MTETQATYHQPVMLAECMDGLNIRPDGVYVDVTFGGGGHSRAIIERLGNDGRLIAFDQDADALVNTIPDPRFTLIHENFKHLKAFLRLNGIRHIDGLIADLGVSSHQFDEASRGFSTRFDGQLDLRMDRRQDFSAKELVNDSDEADLCRILRLYGELPNAMQMAHAIRLYRNECAIETTQQLKDAVSRHLPKNQENKYLAMLFQALRIEVNGELEALKQLLQQATQLLNPGGRLVVMSYHSLEDRIVKNYMRAGNFEGEIAKDFFGNPLVPYKLISRKAITASAEELQYNNRARSAKLRIAERNQTEFRV
ncbi:MAG: 16S rRNA (cytosine(1402)-N(4))-methyltransferase RsmH [Bacteroidales bacterium]|nr:16S rRNA (cytosine(1402)-N(4))-methyltransferase RsmH [Candidatus Colimorpha onthohippi]